MARSRLFVAAAVALCALPLTGCIAYPDGAVVRRPEGYVARSACGAGSDPQLTKVIVTVSPPQGSKQRGFSWTAEASGAPVHEVPLFVPSEGVTASPQTVPPITAGSTVVVAIETTSSLNGGASFGWDAIPVGQGLSWGTEEPVAEADLPGPSPLDKDCGGVWSATTLMTLVRGWFGLVVVAGIVATMVVAGRRRLRPGSSGGGT